METDPEIPAPTKIPPAIIPGGPPTIIRAMPAPVVIALELPVRATAFVFLDFCFCSSLSSFVMSSGLVDY